MWVHQSRCYPTQERLGCMIKNNREKRLKNWVSKLRSLLNTCLTIMIIVVQGGASRQDHQKKERHTTKKMMNSAAKKRQPAVQSPEKYYFTVSNILSSERVTEYIWQRRKESMNNAIGYVAPKKKIMEHRMSLHNRILWFVIISIFWFNKYWQRFFNFMEIKKPQPSNSSCKPKHSTPRRTSRTMNNMISSDWEPSTSRQW